MSILYDYAALAFDIALTAYLIKLHRKESETINNIKNAPLVDIGSDLATLLEAYPHKTLPYAVVRGRVTETKDSFESSTGIKGVMQIVTMHEITAKRFGDTWDTGNMRPMSEARNSVSFALKPLAASDSSNISVEVVKPFDSVWENLLLPTSSAFTPANSTLDTALLGGTENAKILGVRRTEQFLPVGTIVTGVGQIIKDVNGTLKLQESDEKAYPYVLTTLPIKELVSKLEVRKTIQQIMICTTLSIGLVLLSRRAYSWWKKYKLTKLRNSILRERRNLNLDDLCRCQTCLVCLLNPREIILLDCGHVCVCADCVLKVNGSCPVCRERIQSTHKAYIA